MRRFLDRVNRFFYTPASAAPLAVLRIGLAACLLLQAFSLASPYYELYTTDGILQGVNGPASELISTAGWFTLMARLGIGERGALSLLAISYLASLLTMLVGFHTRVAVAAVWVTHLLLTNGQPSVYGFDAFASAALFILLWAPCGDAYSWDRGRHPPRVSPGARLLLRVFQIYLCIAYLACGIEKAVGPQWWSGEAIWRSLNLPTYSQFNTLWLARFPVLPKIAGWFTLLVECGYAIFIWPRATRRLWILLTLMLHAGIAVFLGLQLFGLIMMTLTFSIWAVPAEPRALALAYQPTSEQERSARAASISRREVA